MAETEGERIRRYFDSIGEHQLLAVDQHAEAAEQAIANMDRMLAGDRYVDDPMVDGVVQTPKIYCLEFDPIEGDIVAFGLSIYTLGWKILRLARERHCRRWLAWKMLLKTYFDYDLATHLANISRPGCGITFVGGRSSNNIVCKLTAEWCRQLVSGVQLLAATCR